MTCLQPEPTHSIFDLTLDAATQRIAGLRDETHRSRHASATSGGVVKRSRRALGRRLIAIGSALVGPSGHHRPAITR